MNGSNLNARNTAAPRLVDSQFATPENPPVRFDIKPAEAQLLDQLRKDVAVDSEIRARLEDGLKNESDSDRLWFLLASLDHAPQRTVSTELVFTALCRLSESASPVIRLSAYRWLAGLHTIDLRFETRARLKLRDCRETECELIQQRLEYLLSVC